jgi:hypothetical protein
MSRRWLRALGIVWRRAAPTLRISDPHKEVKLTAIKEALDTCDADNPVFYENEVDIHLNPKLGADWGFKGKEHLVLTPRRNEKYHLGCGQLHHTQKQKDTSVVQLDQVTHLRELNISEQYQHATIN